MDYYYEFNDTGGWERHRHTAAIRYVLFRGTVTEMLVLAVLVAMLVYDGKGSATASLPLP